MSPHPTLDELRTRVHKARHREVGNWLARRVGRPSAIYGTWAALRMGLTANQVTTASLLASLGAALAIGGGTRLGFVAGVVLAHLAFWLDHVDGQVARWRGTSNLGGVYFDYLMHHASASTLGFALGYGLAVRTGDPRWSLAGFLIASGWLFLGLHNDCRYKAFFQKLKREAGPLTVRCSAGDRPAPASSWPRRGRGLLTWPAYKACEPHVVLIGLTVLAGLALGAPSSWLAGWRWGAAGMSGLAPALAVARAARTVRSGAVDSEFDRWFRPL